jgi:hypothetical protein
MHSNSAFKMPLMPLTPEAFIQQVVHCNLFVSLINITLLFGYIAFNLQSLSHTNRHKHMPNSLQSRRADRWRVMTLFPAIGFVVT